MSRFYFHLSGDLCLRDEEGTDLPSLAAAAEEGMRFFGRFVADRSKEFEPQRDLQLDVTDENGLLLFNYQFSLALAPVAESALRKRQTA